MSSAYLVQQLTLVGCHKLNVTNVQMRELSQLCRLLAEQGISILFCRVQQKHQYPGEKYSFIPGIDANIIVDAADINLDSIIQMLPTGGDMRHTVSLHFFSLVEAPELTASMQDLSSMVEIRTTADIGRGVTFPDSEYTILDVAVEGAVNFAPTEIIEGDEVRIIVANAAVLAAMDGPLAALQQASRQPENFLECVGAFS